MLYITHLIGTLEACRNDFIDDVHEVLGLLNDMVHFNEGGGFSNRRIFNRKLKRLNISGNLVQMLKEFLLWLPCWNLKFNIIFL